MEVSEQFMFATVGSVDDGKSTLVGRLLLDTESLFDDQIESLSSDSQRLGSEGLDLAMVTDGLRDEREQGITIDVAYRYFSTSTRRFMIADCPGHTQHTRNAVTGMSRADAVVVLIDAVRGLTRQTRRHLAVAALLRVPSIVLAINKMDLIDWSEARFEEVAEDSRRFLHLLDFGGVIAVPVSALQGDNVTSQSLDPRLSWYTGDNLLEVLGSLEPITDEIEDLRLPVQLVIRRTDGADGAAPRMRSYAGLIQSGCIRVDDPIAILPSGVTTRVSAIWTPAGPADTASQGMSVGIQLADDVDVVRGDQIVGLDQRPSLTKAVFATVIWFSDGSATIGQQLLIKYGTRTVKAAVQQILGELDLDLLGFVKSDSLASNAIGRVLFRLASPLGLDLYSSSRSSGAFLIVDEWTGATLGAGMVSDPECFSCVEDVIPDGRALSDRAIL